MLSDEEISEIFQKLGLTNLESNVYLTLCKHQSLSTKAISKLTKTSQPDTYRVLATLQEKGLIEKIIKRPAIFKIIPCEKGIFHLLERRKAEYIDLEAKTKSVLCALKEKNISRPLENEDLQFVLIPQREAVVDKIKDAIERARNSVDLSITWKRFLYGITVAFAESLDEALARGVMFRIIVENPETIGEAKQALQISEKSPLCNIRFSQSRPKTVIGLYDSKEVFIIVNPKAGLQDSPALWSNSQSLISVVQDYFDILWLTSLEEASVSTRVHDS